MSNLTFKPGIYAAIDCGTGNMRMQALKVEADGAYELVLNESCEHEIGRDLTDHKALTPETVEVLIAGAQKLVKLAKDAGAISIKGAATESLRAATNGAEVLDRLAREAIPFTILSGLDELQTSLMGVLPYLRDIEQNFYFADSGGGSTEVGVIQANDFSIIEGDSLQVGVATWGHRLEVHGDVTEAHHMEEAVTEMTQTFGNAMAGWPILGPDATLVVAGAPMHLFRYSRRIQSPSHLIEDRTLTRKEVEDAAAEMGAMGMSGRLKHPRIDGKGASFMLPCSLKIMALMNVTGIEHVRIVPSGICAGMCLKQAQTTTNKVAS